MFVLTPNGAEGNWTEKVAVGLQRGCPWQGRRTRRRGWQALLEQWAHWLYSGSMECCRGVCGIAVVQRCCHGCINVYVKQTVMRGNTGLILDPFVHSYRWGHCCSHCFWDSFLGGIFAPSIGGFWSQNFKEYYSVPKSHSSRVAACNIELWLLIMGLLTIMEGVGVPGFGFWFLLFALLTWKSLKVLQKSAWRSAVPRGADCSCQLGLG